MSVSQIQVGLPIDLKVGPGCVITLDWGNVGPITTDALWDVSVVPDVGEGQPLHQVERTLGTKHRNFTMGVRGQTTFVIDAQSSLQQDTPVHLNVTLTDPVVGLVDTTTVNGLKWTLQQQWQQVEQQTTAQGGLSTQEHGWLDATQQAVARVFTDIAGAFLDTPIGSLLSHPDLAILSTCGSVFELTGRGTLDPLSQVVGFQPYGLSLALSAVPPGFGLRDGSVTAYTERLGQFVVLHSVKNTGTQWITETMDLHLAQRLWLWEQAFPHAILFDITPGCAVLAQWVCAQPF